jgi:threonine dehydrogenase-like Zn-dependent dehydrogenase
MADIAIDAVGIEATWQGAIGKVRTGGSVTVIGLGQAEGAVAVGDMVRRAITLRGHYAYTRADFDAALALLAEHPPGLEWVTVMPLRDGAEAFRRLVEEPAGTIKALLATP